jgi:patatin-like phospholipase/acyl hydrolase
LTQQLTPAPATPCRVLSLDGGGAKGFYTLGVLKEIEALAGRPLYQCFNLIFGTSTGGIIAALLALGYQVDEIHKLAICAQRLEKVKSVTGRVDRAETHHIGIVFAL